MKYASCDRCGKSFEHCGFCTWCKCGRHWCGSACAEADGYHMDDSDRDINIPVRDLFKCNWCDKPKQKPSYHIREMNEEDLMNGSFIDTLRSLHSAEIDLNRTIQFYQFRQDRDIRTFVAVDGNDKVIGTASLIVEPKFIHNGSWVGHIEDVAVHREQQRNGIGKMLINHLVESCRIHECYKVVLYCDHELVPFYQKMGFKVYGDLMILNL